jgi:ABC-type branched-subunit amino acid transport system ATPase component/ABC-type branched-subunit amino acid transport system permease subunit
MIPAGAVVAFDTWFGWTFPAQVLFNGAVRGLGYAVIAAGLVLIYRSSGIVNFAQAAIGAFGVNLFALLAIEHGVPYWVALAAGVASGLGFALVTELIVVRRLFNASRVVLLIATVGVAQLILTLILLALPDVFGPIPIAFSGAWADIVVTDSLRIGPRETSVLVLITPVFVALALFLTRTRFGLHIRAVADSPENAQLVGVSPRRVSSVVWGLAGAFAAYTQIVLAPVNARTAQELSGVSSTGLLLRVLLVALLARMRSIPLVVVGGLMVGALENSVAINLNRNVGIIDLFLFVAVLGLVVLRGGVGAREDSGFTVGVKVAPIPAHLRSIWWVRLLPRLGLGAAFLFLALLPPLVWNRSSQLLVWTEVVLFAAIAISLSLLTGWGGQLSLGQVAFAGVGGMATVALSREHPITFGILGWDWFEVSLNLPWLVALVAGTLVGALAAVVVGLPALRIKGLFLAVTTLAFAAMVGNWLLRQDAWNGGSNNISRLPRPEIGGLSFTPPRTFYFLCLGFLLLVVLAVSQLRRTGVGRSIVAVRDNERMTAAATVSPARTKLTAFAVAGGIAAMAGGLLVYLLPGFEAAGPNSPFSVEQSVRVVAIAIIGGIGSVAGGILGALWVIGLPSLFPDWDAINLLTADIGLLVLLLYFPGGFTQVLYNARDGLLRWVEDRRGLRAGPSSAERPRSIPTRQRTDEPVPTQGPWLELEDVSVVFGGLIAVSEVTLHVERGELVGLIGTNGAGKSTLMNAISGFVPATGRISVLGSRVDQLRAHERHAVGLGRGFQDASLFPALTVRETVLVALEAREHSLLLPSLTHLPPSPRAERRKRSEADTIIDFLGLGQFADRFISDLSTGTRRIVELACLIATDAKVLLLDEPTGGVAQRETEAFAPLIKRVQRELGASVVVIEHDMPLIMSISDRVYCLEAGTVIAEGTPDEVRSDPLVIASYLGTDERAIHRTDIGADT